MKGLPRIAWVGLAILAIAGVLLSLGRRETQSFPAADSFSPSGASVFFELLKRHGYSVEVDRTLRPKLQPRDLVVAFEFTEPPGFWDEMSQGNEEPRSEFEKPFNAELKKHFAAGGKAIFLPLDRDYLAASRDVVQSSETSAAPVTGGKPLQTTLGVEANYSNPLLKELLESHSRRPVRLWVGPAEEDLVQAVKIDKGVAFVPRNGIIATNRFIDRGDNAQLLSQLVHTMAPKGSRIVFTEASFGNVHQKGFLEAIAPWADAAWQQLLLLAIVIIYTLGKRLGFPEEYRTRQRGSRELVDALGDTMNRARAAHLAMNVALNRSDVELRMALRLPRETERIRRDELLPHELRTALARLEAAVNDKGTPEKEALRLIKHVDTEMTAFLGPRRVVTPARATIEA